MSSRAVGHLEGSAHAHAARSAVRGLVASWLDCWDEGDCAGFAEKFVSGGVWRVPAEVDDGDAANVVERFARWRAVEPWSCHWLTNEHITSDGQVAGGNWLWLAASTIDVGRSAAWSGGDLAIDAVRTRDGWKIRQASMTTRFRSPYAEGWLKAPLVPIVEHPSTLAVPDASASNPTRTADLPGDNPIDAATPPVGWLVEERAVRNLMADHLHDVDMGVAGPEIAGRWVDDGVYQWDGSAPPTQEISGRAAIGEAFDRQQGSLSAVARFLTSESITLEEDRATCRWRDLWAAISDRQSARWIGHRYLVVATRDDATWRFSRMKQETVLDCPYEVGWLPSHGGIPE
jgi:hypothetical protein